MILENDGSAQQSRAAERKAMIDRAHDLPITRQAEALSAVAASTTCRGWCRKPTWRSCSVPRRE